MTEPFTKEEFSTIADSDGDNLGRAVQANARLPRDASATFCSVSPQAKQGLTVLRSIVDFVPGIGSFKKMAILIANAAGDAAEKGLSG